MSTHKVNNDTLDLLASFLAFWGPFRKRQLQTWLFLTIKESRLGVLKIESPDNPPGKRKHLVLKYDNATEVKRELHAEYEASLKARFQDEKYAPIPLQPFRFINPYEATLCDVIDALVCYQSQCDWTDDWKTSFAKALCCEAGYKTAILVGRYGWEGYLDQC